MRTRSRAAAFRLFRDEILQRQHHQRQIDGRFDLCEHLGLEVKLFKPAPLDGVFLNEADDRSERDGESRPPALDDEIVAGTAPQLIDVEILGHIFEQSINDLEQLHQEIAKGSEGEPAAPSGGGRTGLPAATCTDTDFLTTARGVEVWSAR